MGEVYHSTVKSVMPYGVFVEIMPGKEGLLHISEVSTHRLPHIEDAFKPGDKVLVMVKEIDDQGRVNLTRRRVLANEEKVRAAGLAYALPDERERDNLIATLASRERGYSTFSMRDRVDGFSGGRGYSSGRGGRGGEFGFGRETYDRSGRRNDRRRDY